MMRKETTSINIKKINLWGSCANNLLEMKKKQTNAKVSLVTVCLIRIVMFRSWSND